MRLTVVLTLLTIFNALILGVALYTLTRDGALDLALLALTCRVAEGVINAIPAITMLALLSDAAAANALGGLLLKVQAWSTTAGATVFAVGSTLYSYLFLRARSIPVPFAWLGVAASVLLVVTLPMAGLGLIQRRGGWIYMVAPARVRSDARAVAAHQGRRRASDSVRLPRPADRRLRRLTDERSCINQSVG
jgi:hypothetical protein